MGASCSLQLAPLVFSGPVNGQCRIVSPGSLGMPVGKPLNREQEVNNYLIGQLPEIASGSALPVGEL